MDTELEATNWMPVESQTLIKSLKCPICWEYFVKPHTLACGHTFCLRCLQLLLRAVQTSRVITPLERHRFHCPSCRKLTCARPILRRHAAINYTIKELLEEWFQSPYLAGNVEVSLLRSVGSQTGNEHNANAGIDGVLLHIDIAHHNNTNNGDLNIAQDECKEILIHRITSKPGLEMKEKNDNSQEMLIPNIDDSGLSNENSESSSSDNEELEQEVGPQHQIIQVFNDYSNQSTPRSNRLHFFSIYSICLMSIRLCFMVFLAIWQSRSHAMLTLFWFIYCTIIVSISTAFLPWMVIYTICYFVIIHAESVLSYIPR